MGNISEYDMYNHGTGNSHAIRNSACNKNSLIAIQFIKDVGDCLIVQCCSCTARRFAAAPPAPAS